MNKVPVQALMSGVAIGGLIGPGLAADMVLKAPRPESGYSWSGAYGGVNVGAGFFRDPVTSADMQRFTGDFPPGTPEPLQSASDFASTNAFPFAGLQLGYNWRLGSRGVVGFEADIAKSRTKSGIVSLAEGPIAYSVQATTGVDWFGTVRGRLGYIIDPRLLAYLTGGLAYGRTRNDFVQTATGPGPIGTFGFNSTGCGTRAGWTLGSGLEYALDRSWSIKGEYRYLAFKDAASTSTIISFISGKKGTTTGVFNVAGSDNSAHTLTLGLDYHFWGK